MAEAVAELRARIFELIGKPGDEALAEVWPAIDGMLAAAEAEREELRALLHTQEIAFDEDTKAAVARLATAEADADQLYDMLDTHWDSGSHCNDWAEEDDEAMQLHRDALTLRNQR